MDVVGGGEAGEEGIEGIAREFQTIVEDYIERRFGAASDAHRAVVEVSYRDELGRAKRTKADGLLARCIQHEMDHLNGVLFVDRVTDHDKLREGLDEKGFNPADVRAIA